MLGTSISLPHSSIFMRLSPLSFPLVECGSLVIERNVEWRSSWLCSLLCEAVSEYLFQTNRDASGLGSNPVLELCDGNRMRALWLCSHRSLGFHTDRDHHICTLYGSVSLAGKVRSVHRPGQSHGSWNYDLKVTIAVFFFFSFLSLQLLNSPFRIEPAVYLSVLHGTNVELWSWRKTGRKCFSHFERRFKDWDGMLA